MWRKFLTKLIGTSLINCCESNIFIWNGECGLEVVYLPPIFQSLLMARKFEASRGLILGHHLWRWLGGVHSQQAWVQGGCLAGYLLGIPLYGKPTSVTFWQSILDRISKKLRSSQLNFLSKVGRLILINATLSNLPAYCLSLYHVPTTVAEEIERLYKHFLWSGNRGSNINHLLKWNIIKQSIVEGGLGIMDIR